MLGKCPGATLPGSKSWLWLYLPCLSPTLCKVGMMVIATSRVAVRIAGTVQARSEGSVCPVALLCLIP